LMRPRAVPCLSLTEQVAQKIHALTEPGPRGRVNMRARDVLDVLLLDARLLLDTEAITQACVIIFAQRATHEWPILRFSFPSEWDAMLAEFVRQVNYDTSDVGVIEKRFNTFLARLNGAPPIPLGAA
jgi:hypothetical protein